MAGAGDGDGIEDDDSIVDDARLLRRIPPTWVSKPPRPDSSNFEERCPMTGLSVTLWEGEADFENTVAEKPSFGIVRVTAAQLRAAGLKLVRVPLVGNPNHCECYGKPSQRQRKNLANVAVWVKVPDGAEAEIFGALDQL